MSEGIKMQLINYCEAVRVGIKPVAMMSIQTRYVDETLEIVREQGGKSYIQEVKVDENWKVIWIYKYEYLLDVIKVAPEHPNSIQEHWILGKLFGYSDEAINEFLSNNYFLEGGENNGC